MYGEGSIPSIKQLISNTQKGYASPVSKKYLNKIAIKNSFQQLRENINNSVDGGQTASGMQSMMYECTQHETPQNNCDYTDGSNLRTKQLYDCDGTKVCNAIDQTKETNNKCPIGNSQFVIPVVISLLDSTIYMFDKKAEELRPCIIMSDNLPINECGATYFYFESTNNSKNIPKHSLLSRNIIVGLMLKHSDTKHLYYVIRWDWKDLLVDKNKGIIFDYPRSEHCYY